MGCLAQFSVSGGICQKLSIRRARAADFEMLVQSVTDYAIYMLDIEGYVSSWNAGARRFKGYEAEEIIGAHFSRFYTPRGSRQGYTQDRP